MSAANDAPDEVCPETKKFPKQGTMLREFAYGSPRQERRRLTPETEASRGGGNTLHLAPTPQPETKTPRRTMMRRGVADGTESVVR